MESEDNKRVIIAKGLRVVAAACFVVAGLVLEFVARGTDWHDDVKFYLYVNFIASGYNILILALPRNSKLGNTIAFIIDLVLCILLSSSLGVGWQTYRVFNKGNSRKNYEDNYYAVAVCGHGIAQNFCRNILVSFILSTIGFVISFVFHAYCIIISLNALEL